MPSGRPSESEVRRRRAAGRGVVATATAGLRAASPGAWASFKDGGAPVLAGGRRRTMLSAAAAGRAAAQAAQVHALFMHGGYWWCTCVGCCCCCCCCRSVAEVAAPPGEEARLLSPRALPDRRDAVPCCGLHCGEEGGRTTTARGLPRPPLDDVAARLSATPGRDVVTTAAASGPDWGHRPAIRFSRALDRCSRFLSLSPGTGTERVWRGTRAHATFREGKISARTNTGTSLKTKAAIGGFS